MKKSLVLVFTVLTLSLFVFSEVKIGVINPQRVINTTIRGKQVKVKLEKLGKSKQQSIQSLEDEIKKLEKELMSPALNIASREKKTVDLTNKKTRYKRYVEDAQKDFQRQYQKEMQVLYKEIMPIIKSIGNSKGFTVILDLSTAGISYFNPTIDITNEVIKAYDAKQTANK